MNDPEPTGAFKPDGSDVSDNSVAVQPHNIGRYRVERVLGQGGFGVVYLAHDEQLQRLVAIKVPHRHRVSSPEDAEAYLTEARTVANLDHPNIVPVYDVGSTEDYSYFIVSKFIEGHTLAQRVNDDRPTSSETAELVATVAQALHYAHGKGLVHRDIKPGNILLDTTGKPYVADFGLALREQDIGKKRPYAGTPSYTSPEQARGEAHRIDGRSDIFSLGVVFYELLVGRRPFRADSQAELLEQVTNHEPRPPRQHDDSIPKELERICLKALSKRASDRYTTANDMADDLRHFLNSSQREAAPRGTSSSTLLSARGNLSEQSGLSDQRAKVARSTFFFADFKGFTERVRILEKTAGHQAAAEMKRKVAHYIEESFRQLEGEIKPDDYKLIDTAGDGFFFHFRSARHVFRFAEALHRLTTAHNAHVTDEIAEHWFRTGAATGDVAWDEGKPVGHVVNVGSRLQAAATGCDFVIDPATYDDLLPEAQQQFGPKESIQDKHDKTFVVYRTAFGRVLTPLPVSPPPIPNPATPVFRSTPVLTSTSASDIHPLKIVPKGLRSFDAHDADFFLELLPGPKDRDGLPDSIRFWKTRIEETDADKTFTVGLSYGPSGCGKSSLVKAGLLPRLSDNVIVVYVEATAQETEVRVLNSLRKRWPALSNNLSLRETLAVLRQGQDIPAGKKVLIVLDQFEQWLHAKKEEENTELVQGLRQCDGARVQTIVLVRDDFWMAATRFMRELEVRLVEAQNSAAVDLFPIRHAEKVLEAFGRAFGALPEASSDDGGDHRAFLHQAVASLAQEGKVICVRLALFAEMMKGKAWTPASLKEVGGTEGVGAAFLEETFGATSAPPEHRYHQRAARSVLKALLPESGSDIKGHMRSHQELLEASGYAKRPKDFDDLIRILDTELRLITPTDPEGKEEGTASSLRGSEKYYQLTHDYLVPSLRDWLTRKQKETRRGRAELLLADRAAVWNARQENRQLPSIRQWLSIRWLTVKKNWTTPQRKMMRKARRYHAMRAAVLGLLLVVATFAGLTIRDQVEERNRVNRERGEEQRNATHAAGLVNTLLTADTTDSAQLKRVIGEMAEYRKWTDPLLREEYDKAAAKSRQKLHAGVALLSVDATQVDPALVEYLFGRLLGAEPPQVPIIRDALAPHKDMWVEKLWSIVEMPEKGKEPQRLRAASALAAYDRKNAKWKTASALVVNDLVRENPIFLGIWSEAFRSVKDSFLVPLGVIFRDLRPERAAERSLATNLLADYAADDVNELANLLMDADEKQFAAIWPTFKEFGEDGLPRLAAEIDKKPSAETPSSDPEREKLAERQANAAVALLRMNHPGKVWPLLKRSEQPDDPRVRSYLIHKLSPLGADPRTIVTRLDAEKDIAVRRALLLSLGEYGELDFTLDDRKALVPKLREMYRTDADPGLHSACEWLLRKWEQQVWLEQENDKWKKDTDLRKTREEEIRMRIEREKAKAPPRWYVNSQGRTMVVIPGPVEFLMGSPKTEKDHFDPEIQQRRRIGRTFAIAAKAVTWKEYLEFAPKEKGDREDRLSPSLDCPVNYINWYMAVRYCNWLSEKEELEPCYEIKGPRDVNLKENYLSLTGYRLPTEAELEYATRAGAKTSRYYGETEELLGRYARYQKSSEGKAWPVGSLKPNDLGLFDAQGNLFTWCQESYRTHPEGGENDVYEDKEETTLSITQATSLVLRGGSFLDPASLVRSAYRVHLAPTDRLNNVGFRPSRTLPCRN